MGRTACLILEIRLSKMRCSYSQPMRRRPILSTLGLRLCLSLPSEA
jgi:hypothetical protein